MKQLCSTVTLRNFQNLPFPSQIVVWGEWMLSKLPATKRNSYDIFRNHEPWTLPINAAIFGSRLRMFND